MLGAIDTGSFVLAEAGLLQRQRLTLHWEAIDAFRERYPHLQVTQELFEIDGRRIVPAVSQITSMLIDRGMDVETIFHTPRIDVSGTGPVRANWDLPAATREAIAARLPVTEVPNVIYPLNFANPSCIVRDPRTGELTGMNEVMSPWAGGAAAG